MMMPSPLQSRPGNRGDRPRITITRAPTLDRSSVECLYPQRDHQQGLISSETISEQQTSVTVHAPPPSSASPPPFRKKRHVFVNFEARDRKKERKMEEEAGAGVAARRGRRQSDVRITVTLPPHPACPESPPSSSSGGTSTRTTSGNSECLKLGRLLWRFPDEMSCDSPR